MSETKKYYHNIDLIKNKLSNPILNPLTSTERNALSLGVNDEGYVTFDTTLNKQYFWDGTTWIASGGGGGGGTVDAVTASSPLSSSGGSSPNITIQQASGSQAGYLSSTDWNTFNTKEPAISVGTTAQYWRGDKSWQTLNSAAVGLSNVENIALSTWAGSTNLTTLGTIGAGTWQGTAIVDDYISSANTWNGKFTNNVSNGSRLLGRYSTNGGAVQEITIGTGLTLNPTTGTLTASGGTSGPTGFEQHFLLMGA